MTAPEDRDATSSWKRPVIAVAIGLASGLALVVLPYVLVWLASPHEADDSIVSSAGFNLSLTFLLPVIQGVALGSALGSKPFGAWPITGLVAVTTMIELSAAALFLREGAICLIVAAPLEFGVMLFGAWVGRAVARGDADHTVRASLIPLIVLGVFAEATGPRPDYTSVVTDTLVIHAPPEYVWRYVLTYPENNAPPEYWLWRVGLPAPVQSVAEAPRLGAARVCRFEGGLAFEERITELEPNAVMTFTVTKQPDHPEVIGHFQFDQGQIRLTRNTDGSTTVTATSWYRLFVRPAVYFDLWTADITRQVHFRVLNHIKRLAERDYAEARSPQR